MLDIGWSELFVIGVILLIVVGPKELPKALRTIAGILAKMRSLSREFQDGLADLAREAEFGDIKRSMQDVGDTVRREADPTGTLTSDFDPAQFRRELKAAVEGGPSEGPRPGAPRPSDPETPSTEAASDATTPQPSGPAETDPPAARSEAKAAPPPPSEP